MEEVKETMEEVEIDVAQEANETIEPDEAAVETVESEGIKEEDDADLNMIDLEEEPEEEKDDKVGKAFNKVKGVTGSAFHTVKNKATEISQDESFKAGVAKTKDTVNSAVNTINENETFQKAKGSVVTGFNTIKNNENVQKGFSKAKKSTLSFTKKALSKVEQALEDDHTKEEDVVIHTVNTEE